MMKKLTSIGLVCAMCMALMIVSVAAAAEGEVPQAANSVSGSTASGQIRRHGRSLLTVLGNAICQQNCSLSIPILWNKY